MKIKKVLLALLVAGLLSFPAAPALAAEADNVPIFVNGALQQDISAYAEHGRTMVPIRDCAALFRATVSYDHADKRIGLRTNTISWRGSSVKAPMRRM